MPISLAKALVAAARQGQRRNMLEATRDSDNMLGQAAYAGTLHMSDGLDAAMTGIDEAVEDSAGRLMRRIEYLSVIGNIAPMVGLLGTVTGMLLAFKQVADTEGNAGAAQLADGIYQALVTTVAGLIIAIPALGAFALFRSRVDQLVAESAYAALHALSPLKQRSTSASAPPIQPPAPPPPPRK
jgi:biopolymer transport protein ExbB